MTIYMHIPQQRGEVTQKSYEGWIAINGFSFSTERVFQTHLASNFDLQTQEIFLYKPIDKVSPYLFSEAFSGKGIPEVKIDVINSQHHSLTRIILTNVMISEYNAFIIADDTPLEAISLNFTHLEFRYQPENQQTPPLSTKYATGSRASQASLLKRSLATYSDEGFKLFVATVYGEACGQSEVAWQAVASTIINRVNNRYFHVGIKHHTHKATTPEQVIKQPLWYEAYDCLTPNFLLAYDYLNGKTHKAPLHLEKMYALLKPIYYQNKVITNADHYFSPNSQKSGNRKNPKKYKNKTPKWAKDGLESGELEEVLIPFLSSSDDFQFFTTTPFNRRKHG